MAKVNKKEKTKKALIILPIFIGVGGALWYFLRRKVVADPNKAILFGKVVSAGTLTGIQGIDVNCNGYAAKTNDGGDYQIVNIPAGTYSVTFTDPLERYEPQEV